MPRTSEHDGFVRGKDPVPMPRRRPRPYGTGVVIELKNGLAIRWRETVILNGVECRVMRYENLGDVTKKEAEARLAEKQTAARRQGPQVAVEIPLFREVAARYERDILSVHKFSVQVVRKTILNVHLIPRFGATPVSAIATVDIQRFFTELREAGYIQ